MLKVYNYEIVFQEVPNEVTLAFNITGCPHRCMGCHSPFLREDIGVPLKNVLPEILEKYKNYITCVCFMGGDQNHKEICEVCDIVKEYNIKTCMYSGDENIDKELLKHLNFYKIGGYKQELGGLSCKETNQRFYKINENEELEDITYVFRQKNNK